MSNEEKRYQFARVTVLDPRDVEDIELVTVEQIRKQASKGLKLISIFPIFSDGNINSIISVWEE